MGNTNGSSEALSEETADLLMQRTGKPFLFPYELCQPNSICPDMTLSFRSGMSKYDLDVWYKAIVDRSKKGKLSKEQMVAVYRDMSDLDATRIHDVVDSLARVFDEDHSGAVDINEFLRGFILTTKGDLQSKIDYTFRLYDQNNDNQISGEEIKQMANSITRMLGGDEAESDEGCRAIIQQFLKQFTGSANGVIYKHDFIRTVMQNRELLAILSPFYGID